MTHGYRLPDNLRKIITEHAATDAARADRLATIEALCTPADLAAERSDTAFLLGELQRAAAREHTLLRVLDDVGCDLVPDPAGMVLPDPPTPRDWSAAVMRSLGALLTRRWSR